MCPFFAIIKDRRINMSEKVTSENYQEFNFTDEFLDWIEAILFSIFIAVTFFTYILKPAQVDGPSMTPTLLDSDKIFTSNLLYTPKQGDIVTIDAKKLDESIVKRVIAVEGQTINIDFDAGKVFVDDKELTEPYINDYTYLDLHAFQYPVTVPEGHVFVMGDNRNNSKDSRHPDVGFVDVKDIWGKVVFRIYPFDRFGMIK